MLVLGIETSCDETGVALYDTDHGLQAQALHSQVAMHNRYGGVVPELASRDHVERLVPLLEQVMADAQRPLSAIDAIAYTQGPGLAGALLVGASVATALAMSLDRPVIGVHHLEGHLLSPLLSDDPPEFPFAALLTGFVTVWVLRRGLSAMTPVLFFLGLLLARYLIIMPLGVVGMMRALGFDFGKALMTDMAFWASDAIKSVIAVLLAYAVHRAFPRLLAQR